MLRIRCYQHTYKARIIEFDFYLKLVNIYVCYIYVIKYKYYPVKYFCTSFDVCNILRIEYMFLLITNFHSHLKIVYYIKRKLFNQSFY